MKSCMTKPCRLTRSTRIPVYSITQHSVMQLTWIGHIQLDTMQHCPLAGTIL